MIKHVVWKEFHETTRDGRFLCTCAIIVALLLVSLVLGWNRYSDARALRDAAAAETRQQWLSQGVKNPHSAQHYGVYAFKPVTPLSLFDPGVTDFTGTVALLEAHKQNEFKYKAAQDATSLQRFGDLSAAMIFQLLVPLLIILLTFNSVAGEREEGTLRQVLSLGVSPRTLILGKALGTGLTLALALVPATLIGMGIIAWMAGGSIGDDHLLPDMGWRVALMALCYVGYFALLIVGSLVVSILTRSSRAALTILLGFWIVTGLLLPRAASDIGRLAYPTPSALSFSQAVTKEKAEGPMPHNPSHPNFIAFREATLRKFGVSRVEDLPVNFFGYALQADEQHGYRVYDRQYGALWAIFDRQNRLQQWLGLFSPYLALHSISAAISGTDFALHRDFASQAEQYRRKLATAMNDDIQQGAAGKSAYAADWTYTAGPGLWAKVPPFDYDLPPIARVMAQQWPAFAILAAWLAAAVAGLAFATRRIRRNL